MESNDSPEIRNKGLGLEAKERERKEEKSPASPASLRGTNCEKMEAILWPGSRDYQIRDHGNCNKSVSSARTVQVTTEKEEEEEERVPCHLLNPN